MFQGRKVAILGGQRTPFVKSQTKFLDKTNQQLLTEVLNSIVKKNKLFDNVIGDLIAGAVLNHPFDWNLAREVVLSSKISHDTPGLTIQRACGTGLEACNLVGLKIASGQMESGIAGGSDTNSDIPVIGSRELTKFLINFNKAKGFQNKLKVFKDFRFSLFKPLLTKVVEPKTNLSMGDHCELMVKEWNISRNDQDELSLASHKNASNAYSDGFYSDLLVDIDGLSQDTITRKDTSIEKLSSLKSAFDKTKAGTLTAGNSTPLTDGAALVLLGSDDWAKEKDLTTQAYFVDSEVAAVDFVKGAGLLMAPTIAVAKLLQRNNLKLQDFDYYEIHEAFAGQVLCTLKAWESKEYCEKTLNLNAPLGAIDRSKMNVKGGSLALGHPFAATGARLVATAAKILFENGGGKALLSACTAGGMGVAVIIER